MEIQPCAPRSARGTARRGWLVALGTAILVSMGSMGPAQAGPRPYPAPGQANAEFLDATCSVPSTEDPSVLVMVHRVARNHDADAKVMLAAFEAGWVESKMNNLNCGDSDSLGVFQQRPSQGWGTPEQVTDPVYATTQFITRAIANDRAHPGYTAGQLAQSVQRSAYPGRYDEAQAKAYALLGAAVRTSEMLTGASADFTHDNRDDIVAFTKNASADVYVAKSTGSDFTGTSAKWHDFFGLGGETTLTGDFTGDGKADIVTFTHGDEGDVWVAASNGDSFDTATKWHDWFAPKQEVTAVGDVNGDRMDDIIAFTHDREGDVWVALSDGKSFGPGQKWHEWFAPGGELPRVGYFDDDEKVDIAAFTQGTTADVYVAMSTGSSFGDGQTAPKWHDWFAPAGEFPYVGDYDGDGRDDIVTFTKGSTNDVWVAVSKDDRFGDGTTAVKWHDFFGLGGETTL